MVLATSVTVKSSLYTTNPERVTAICDNEGKKLYGICLELERRKGAELLVITFTQCGKASSPRGAILINE